MSQFTHSTAGDSLDTSLLGMVWVNDSSSTHKGFGEGVQAFTHQRCPVFVFFQGMTLESWHEQEKRVFQKPCAAKIWVYQNVERMKRAEFHATLRCNEKNQFFSWRHESFQVFKSSMSHSQLTECSHLGVILNRSSYRLEKCLQIRSLAKELLSNLS